MNPIGARLKSLGQNWADISRKIAPACANRTCDADSFWQRLRNRPNGVRLRGDRYCRSQCVEMALLEVLDGLRAVPRSSGAGHRIPLGLLLLSRQQITALQLETALEAQQASGRGRIGAWLQELGFVRPQQVTEALARQWACPVLRTDVVVPGSKWMPVLPGLLLESFQMIPVDYVESRSTLYIGFGEGIDYTVLYAIEQMLQCRTEPCLVYPGVLRRSLPLHARRERTEQIVFDQAADSPELVRIIGNYVSQVRAVELRLALCGPYIWVRLSRPPAPAIDLLLRAPIAPNSLGFPAHRATPAPGCLVLPKVLSGPADEPLRLA